MIFILVTAIIMSVLFVWYTMAEQKRQRERVMALVGAGETEDAGTAKEESKRQDIAKKLKDLNEQDAEKKKASRTIKVLLEQSGLGWSMKGYWVFASISACLLAMVAQGLGQPIFVVLMAFIVGLLGVPKSFLKMKAKGRQKKFLADFADALEAMTRLLKSGMPVTEAISMVAREFHGPVGEEMSQIYEAQKVGISLPEATTQAARRMPIPEMNMLATGIAIQAQTGSSLSEALQNLANVIRARHRLKRKVTALSSEAKTSAMIIGALPVFVGSMLYLINPDYVGLLFTHPVGKVLSIGTAVWMSIGIFVMKGMINFKV